ncbi:MULTISPECIES: DUF6232 family protein [unclassified Methylophilus]|uniref:DUF6232 family protein n=1 Tax=unclassified Methylophilus TaxID=2630143 RepID=UPI0003673C75|nr:MULTISPECIES: DUF6232 family protein [unclassified Methylophilus]
MDRKVFFSDGGVIISDSRFIASGYIYNIRDIISVRLGVVEPPRSLAVFILSIGLLFLLTEGALFVVGGCLIALGVMTWLFVKTSYVVVIKTATGEHKVLKDHNSSYIEQVIRALDAALINRGVSAVSGSVPVRGSSHVTHTDFPPMSPPLIE